MGIPKFYRWLSERYPLINQLIADNAFLPEVDNLYLDMNGILHNCSHANDDEISAKTDKDVLLAVFYYIDRIVHIVKPQQLLYMAIDGVAPRAKLNQQRSRRFRSAKVRVSSMFILTQHLFLSYVPTNVFYLINFKINFLKSFSISSLLNTTNPFYTSLITPFTHPL